MHSPKLYNCCYSLLEVMKKHNCGPRISAQYVSHSMAKLDFDFEKLILFD